MYDNSYYDATYSIGLQRAMWQKNWHNQKLLLGYQLGVIYGYDKRMMTWAGELKILPAVLPYLEYQYKVFGAQLRYFGSGMSVGFFVNW